MLTSNAKNKVSDEYRWCDTSIDIIKHDFNNILLATQQQI